MKELNEAGSYCDANPDGGLVRLIWNSHLETHRGRLDFPAGVTNLLYPRLSPNGQLVAGQSLQDRAWLWNGTQWTEHGLAVGPDAVIFDRNNRLVVQSNPNLGPIGFRYVDEQNNIVTGEVTYVDIGRQICEWTALGGVTVGQSVRDGNGAINTIALIGQHRLLVYRGGFVQRVRFKKDGDQLAIAWIDQDRNTSHIRWMTVQELAAFPAYVHVPRKPVEKEPEEKEPVEVAEPASLLSALKREREKLPATHIPGDQIVAMLNRVAKEAADEWGLHKDSGETSGRQPRTGIRCSTDILVHKATKMVYDVLGDAEGIAEPVFDKVGVINTMDNYVPAVEPLESSGGGGGTGGGGEVPDVSIGAALAALGQSINRLVAGYDAELVRLRDRLDGVQEHLLEITHGSGAGGIRPGDRIALKTDNGKYLVAEGGGGGDVRANRDAVGAWETFEVVKP